MKKRSWTESKLKKAVRQSRSYRQVLMRLGLREAGGNYEQIKKYIKEYNINIEHFRGRGWSKGLRGIGKPRIPLEKILVKSSSFQSFKLRNRLFKAGLKPQYCEQCRWTERTADGYIPLELDHVNGNRHDNRLKNLRILCPNCHSLTENHRGRKREQARVVK